MFEKVMIANTMC